MKIKDIKFYFARIPLVPLEKGGISPYRGYDLDYGLTDAESCILEVITDEGVVGWGEMNARINPSVLKTIITDFVNPLVIGKNPLELNKIFHDFRLLCEPPIDTRGFLVALDIACWDILGKVSNLPINLLLGGRIRNEVKIAYCLGLMDHKTTIQKIREIKEEGYKAIKTKGGENVIFDIERAKIMRNTLGEDFDIRVDMNQAYDFVEALHYLNGVDGLNLQYVEQPIAINNPEQLISLRNRSRTPIAINEDAYIDNNLYIFSKMGALDLAVVDLDPVGGISGLIKIANIAESANIPLVHHCGFDMGIKLAAILHVCSAKEIFRYAMDSTYMGHSDDLLFEKIKIQNGHYQVPSGPGLGIEVDEQKLKYFSIEI